MDAVWALSIEPKLKKLWKKRQLVQYFPGEVPRLPETFPKCEPFNWKFRHSEAKLNAERKLPGNNFRSLGIHRKNAVPIDTGSCRKFKPDVLIEWNGAHAKVTEFVTNCAPLARARESSANQVSQVKFSFSMVNEVVS